MADAYRSIARIQKTHGRTGEVVAVPAHGLPASLCPGLVVTVVPPALKGPRQYEVLSCSGNDLGQLVRLDGVSNLDAASKLVGKTLLACVSDLPAELALHDVEALMGREVVDLTVGSLGCIQEVMRGPANDVWVVKGSHGEVLVPVVESMMREFGPTGAIVMDLPSGLVEEGEK